MGTPFKLKGSPMQRNFGISPVKHRLTKQVSTGKGYEGPPGKGKIVEKYTQAEVEHEHSKKKKD